MHRTQLSPGLLFEKRHKVTIYGVTGNLGYVDTRRVRVTEVINSMPRGCQSDDPII